MAPLPSSERRGRWSGDLSVTGTLNPDLLAILVCPLTRTPLRWDLEAGELISDAAGLAYPVREGVPIMIPEHARRLAGDA